MGFRPAVADDVVTTGRGYCPFCQVRCTYEARLRNGRVESLSGLAGNRWTGGAMCPKGLSILELMRSPERLTHPLRRLPSGQWERISYQDAVELTAERLLACMRAHGDKAGDRVAMTMPLWDCRESEIAALLALRAAGSVHAMPPGESCVSSASNMLGDMLGVYSGTVKVHEVLKTQTLVLWGANVAELYPPYSRWLAQAAARGVRIIYIDPRTTRTSALAHTQLRPRPGTDGALAAGALRAILAGGAYDPEQARALLDGFDQLAGDVERYTPEMVSAATGLGLEETRAFYDALAKSPRTIVWLGGSLSRYTNGITTLRAIILAQALRGNVIGEGRGLLTFQSGKPDGDEEFVDHFFGPTQRRKMNFRRLRSAMRRGNLDVLFLNSSYRRYPDAKGTLADLKKVPFIAHMGFFMTEECEAAHLFIPATFGPESAGTGYGNEQQVVWRDQLETPPGECVPGWRFYRDVGRLVDPRRYPDFADPEDLYRQFAAVIPSWKGMDLDALRASPDGLVWPLYARGDAERLDCVFRDGRLLTPDGRMKVVDGLFGRVSEWDYPRGYPGGKDGSAEFPLVLLQGKVLWHWQQTLTNFSPSLAEFSAGRLVAVHPETARAYGLRQGDRVMLETSAGALEGWVDVSETVLPGMVFTPSHLGATAPLERNRGEHINTILPNYWDRISCQHNGVGCRLRSLERA